MRTMVRRMVRRGMGSDGASSTTSNTTTTATTAMNGSVGGGTSGSVRAAVRSRALLSTGVVLTVVLAAAGFALGRNASASKVGSRPGEAWPSMQSDGTVNLVDGVSGGSAAKVSVPGATGHGMAVTQQGDLVFVQDTVTGAITVIDTSQLVAGVQVPHSRNIEILAGGLRAKGSEVDDDRDVGDGPRLHRALDGSPFRSIPTGSLYPRSPAERPSAPLRRLPAHRSRSGSVRTSAGMPLPTILIKARMRVMERSITPIFELGEIFPARTPRIDGCRHPATQGKSIGLYTVISCVGAAFARARVTCTWMSTRPGVT